MVVTTDDVEQELQEEFARLARKKNAQKGTEPSWLPDFLPQRIFLLLGAGMTCAAVLLVFPQILSSGKSLSQPELTAQPGAEIPVPPLQQAPRTPQAERTKQAAASVSAEDQEEVELQGVNKSEYCPKQCAINPKKKYWCKKAVPGEVNIILYGHHWEPINRDADTGRIEHCSAKCNMRYRGWCDAEKADAAVINFLWTSHTRPTKKPPGQRWVMHGGFETQYQKSGAKRQKQYFASMEGKIDWTMGFGPRTDFYNPNTRILPSNTFSGGVQSYEEGASTRTDWGEGKTQLMLWIVSNCLMATTRLTFWNEMQEHLPKKRMLMLGRCGKESPCKSRKDSDPCNVNLFSQYKFYYAAENGQCEGWITEKLTRGLQYGMVPVVFGPYREDYERLVPKDSFIHADDFGGSSKRLSEYLMQLDKDPVAYNKYFAWRSRGLAVFDTYFMYRNAFCELCKELHKPRIEQRPGMQNRSLVNWFFKEGPYPRGACGWVDGPQADR